MATRRHKRKNIPVRVGEGPTPERRKQSRIVTEVIDRATDNKVLMCRYKVIGDTPLDAYLLRGKITQDEHRAGLKFRAAYLRAVLRIRAEDTGVGAHGDPEMAFITPVHSERVLREANGVLTPAQKALIISVCGHDEWAGGTVKLRTLHRALEALVKLWKLG